MRHHPSTVNRLALLLLLACATLLSGCKTAFETENTRLCRMLLPLLHGSGAMIDIAAMGAIEAPGGSNLSGIRIDYLAKAPDQRHTAHYALCYFDPQGFAERGSVLRTLVTDRGEVSDAALVYIGRYLSDPDAVAEIPGPGTAEIASLPRIPDGLANFLQHALASLPMTGVYALLATSYALIYGLIGRINLAFGAFAAIGGVGGSLVLVAMQGLGGWDASLSPVLSVAAALLLAIVLSASWGEAKAVFVLGPIERRELHRLISGDRGAASHNGQPILIATAGLLIALPEMLAIVQPMRWLRPVLNAPDIIARSSSIFVTVTPIALIVFAASMVLALGVLALMRWSAFGRAWRACADDPLTASLFGVSPLRILGRTVMLASALAGFAGFVFCLHYGNFGYGDGRVLGLKALVAAIAGGIGSLPGAILGGVLLGVAEAFWSANLPIESRDIAIFMALVALLVIRPGGLFGFGDLAPRRV